jgi:hypothetical protein
MDVSRIIKPMVSVLMASALALTPVLAHAADEAWLSQAKGLFEQDEYERTLEVAKPHAREDAVDANLFLLFANLQMYHYTKARYYKTRHQGLRDWVEAKAGLTALPRIHYFGAQGDKPEVVKEARRLAAKILAGIYRIEEVPQLIDYARSDDEGMQKLAYKAIKRILKNPRTVVSKGGNMRPKDIAVMQDPKLIGALIGGIEQSDAFAALLLIEEPALERLSATSGARATKLEGKIIAAVKKRKKKFPNSSWHSATGKPR